MGPGSAAVESLGCSAGPPMRGRHRGHLCGSHCLGAGTTWGAPAHGWQVPSESVGVGVIARSHGRERLPPGLGRRLRPVGAGSTSRPAELSSTVFRPRWAGWRPRYPEVWSPGHRPGLGSPRRPGCSSPARVRGVASLGPGGVAAGVRGVLGSWLPAAVPGRLRAVQPAVGGLSTSESEV